MFNKFFKDKTALKNCNIYQMLAQNAKKKHLSFHTPGHKAGGWDITELSFSDNLSSPKGCIAQAEKDVAEILGANKSFLLTDGSTCGILCMLQAAKTLGAQKIAFSETAHKSVWNGCAVLGLQALVFAHETDREILLAADAVLVTSPDYYGHIPDLAALRAFCDEHGKLLLIDGAHGGHLHFDQTLYAGAYADMWVDGVHKSLPALTQGAIVSAKTETYAKALLGAVDIFRTTSPSYPIMASVEYAVKAPQNVWLIGAVDALAQKYPERISRDRDYTKLRVRFGSHAFTAQKDLEKQGVYTEFCDGDILLFYLSCQTEKRALAALEKALVKLFAKYPLTDGHSIHAPVVLPKTEQTEWVEKKACAGRIAARNIGLFPPCVPLVKRGELITNEALSLLEQADNVFGIYEEKILVFKGEEV